MEHIKLLQIAEMDGIQIHHRKLDNDLRGLYYNNNIAINTSIDTSTEEKCVLAEEIGHHKVNSGNLLNTDDLTKSQQEQRGRAWGIEALIDLEKIINAKKEGLRNAYELAIYLDITEEYLYESLQYYKSKLGTSVQVCNYILNLDTLDAYEMLANNELDLHRYIKEYKNMHKK